MPLTVFVGRVLVVPPEETETSPADEPIVVEPPAGAEAAHASRNVIDAGPLVSVDVVAASVTSIDAVMLTAPYAAFVTWTEHVPSAAVVHDAPPANVAPPVPANATVAPCTGASPRLTVAVMVTGEFASAC